MSRRVSRRQVAKKKGTWEKNETLANREINNEANDEDSAKGGRAKAGATDKKRKNDEKSEEKKKMKAAAAADPGSAEVRPQRVRTQTKRADETVSFQEPRLTRKK